MLVMTHNAAAQSDGPERADRSGVARFVAARPFIEEVLRCSACALIVVDVVDRSRPVVYVSPAFCRLIGHSEAECLGRSWNSLLDPEDGGQMPDLGEATRAVDREMRVRLGIRDKRGSSLCLDARMTPLRSQYGGITHCTIVLYDMTAEQRERERLAYEAHHDPLTGLANRRLFCDRFEQAAAHARRHGVPFSLALVDLDGFKSINDSFGHDAGDELLRHVGGQLRQAVRSEDTVARLGGDEFALLLTDSAASISSLVERINELLIDGMPLRGIKLNASCSIGIAEFSKDGVDLEALLKAADRRLYSQKRRSNSHNRELPMPDQHCRERRLTGSSSPI